MCGGCLDGFDCKETDVRMPLQKNEKISKNTSALYKNTKPDLHFHKRVWYLNILHVYQKVRNTTDWLFH